MPKIKSAAIVPLRVWERIPSEVGIALADFFRSTGVRLIVGEQNLDDDGRLADYLVGTMRLAWPRALDNAERYDPLAEEVPHA